VENALDVGTLRAGQSDIQKRGYSKFVHVILVIGDLLFLNLSFFVAYYLQFEKSPLHNTQDYYSALVVVSNLAWLVDVYMLNIYAVSRVGKWEKIIWNIFKAIVVHSFLLAIFVIAIKNFEFSRLFFAAYYGVFVITLLSWRIVFVWMIMLYRQSGYNYRNVAIIGGTKAEDILQYFLSAKFHGYNLKAVFDDNFQHHQAGDEKFPIYKEDQIAEFIQNERLDELYCTLPLTEVEKIRHLISLSDNNMVRFKYVPDFKALLYKKVDIEFYGDVPILSIRKEPLENIGNKLLKRAFDLVFSVLVLVFLGPTVFLPIAIIIKLTSKGPVFFKQLRSGINNTKFYCYKFRTMHMNSDSDTKQAIRGDSRITKIGRFLRKTNLDELPQFVNVLFGHMSVVGPRPHMLTHTEQYKKSIDKFMIRHLVKPGITGWAQVNGFRGVTETPQKMIKRARYDSWYIENWSLFLDLQIVVMTVTNMLKGEKNAF